MIDTGRPAHLMQRGGLFGIGLLFSAVLTLSGCASLEKPGSAAAHHIPAAQALSLPVIPRARLFATAAMERLTMSPDGRHIVFVAPQNGASNLWMASIDRPNDVIPITKLPAPGVASYRFDGSGRRLLIMLDADGSERERLGVLDIETRALTFLDLPQKARTEIVAVSAKRPDEILIRSNDRNPENFDLYILDLNTVERRLVMTGEGAINVFADPLFNRLVKTSARTEGGFDVVLQQGANQTALFSIAADDSRGAAILRLSDDGRVFLTNSSGHDRAVLEVLDIASRRRQTLAADPNADITRVLFASSDGRPLAYRSDFLERRWVVLHPSATASIDYLDRKLPGSFDVVSQSADDGYWLLHHDPVSSSPRYLVFDRKQKKLILIGAAFPDLEGEKLADMTAHLIPARDGLQMVSYLTMPKAAAHGPVPLVLWVHGGPWQRTYREYHATSQWLANRGYAVLSVNFRGSTGFGKAFVNAGDREWGGKMREDILDAAEWAVKRGIAQPDHVAIAGISYGGYAALAGVGMTPERYACAMSMSGPVNLETLLATIPPYWRKEFDELARRVGDPRTDAGRELLAAHSPLNHADGIKRPLFLVQGLNDPRVPPSEVTQLIGKLQSGAVPYTYLAFPDEGHVVSRPNNRLAYYAIFEGFLGRCLGGRVEPLNQEFLTSSGQLTVKP
jgi:dipeptidyl aminopeptidase/acylaminoacyl peptidase